MAKKKWIPEHRQETEAQRRAGLARIRCPLTGLKPYDPKVLLLSEQEDMEPCPGGCTGHHLKGLLAQWRRGDW